MDQTNVQRVLGARSIDQGQKGAIFAGFLKLAIPFILVLPFWIRYLVRNWRGPVPRLAAEARIMLSLLVLLVPLSYLLPVPVPAAH